jgi:hypothetical protein
VHSGGKSCHFIISLKEPLSSLDEYRNFARRLHALLPDVDPATKNASRLSRLPFRIRPDTKRFQKLLFLGERIDNAQLDALLPLVETPTYEPLKFESREGMMVNAEIVYASMAPDELMLKMGLGGRNAFFFWLGKRMLELGYDLEKRANLVEKAYLNLANKKGFSYNEARAAARIK